MTDASGHPPNKLYLHAKFQLLTFCRFWATISKK